jgi:phage baseplate assembly protein W
MPSPPDTRRCRSAVNGGWPMKLDPSKAFLGVGLSFPVAVAPDGSVALSAYEDDIREAILIILQTEPGERCMRPDFGAGLAALTFEPLNTTTMALARHQTEQALVTWEPRITVEDVAVSTDANVRNCLNIDIRYRVRATNTFYNLVFPFYLLEGRT